VFYDSNKTADYQCKNSKIMKVFRFLNIAAHIFITLLNNFNKTQNKLAILLVFMGYFIFTDT